MLKSTRFSVALVTLVVLHTAAVFAGFFAPYSYRDQNRDAPLAPPMEIRFRDRQGEWHLRPFVYVDDTQVPVRLFVRGSRYSILGVLESEVHLFGVEAPARVFLLGTDALGRDYFSRLMYGAQVSLTAGLCGAGLALAVALSLGVVSGYVGGLADGVVMRLTDVFLSLPWLYMLLGARAFLPLDLDPGAAFFVIVVLLGLLGWAGPTRIFRGIVLSAKEREYVGAARGAGAGHAHLLRRHILPQTYSSLLAQATILVPAYMLAEVTLSFVGLGVGEPRPSWGNLLSAIPQSGVLSTEPWMFAPAVMVVVVTWLYQTVLSSVQGGDLRPVSVRRTGGFG